MEAANLDTQLAAIGPDGPEFQARARAWQTEHEAQMRRTRQIPTIEDYRKVYASLANHNGIQWLGDDEIRRMYLVAP